jgi:hypothetical protein
MTHADQATFMTMLIPVFLGGVVSALVTLVLGQPLQHYFWRRQRLAEWQLAVIDQLTILAAELQFLLLYQPEEIDSRREQLATALYRVATRAVDLFSPPAYERFRVVLRTIENILRMSTPIPPEQGVKLHKQLLIESVDALAAFSNDMHIPPRRP